MNDIQFDDIVVSRDRFCVTKAGEARKITPRAFEVLVYLIECRERVVEKQELFDRFWKDAFVTDNALTRTIKEIRQVIGDDANAPSYIETIPKRGFRFIRELAASEALRAGADSHETSPEDSAESLAAGWSALLQADWRDARRHFEAALAGAESPEAWEGLGTATWWLDEGDATFAARERAYLLYRESGRPRDAARLATQLGWDCATFRGDLAIANGWLQRAHRLLEDLPACAEQGWLRMRRASNTLFFHEDPDQALVLANEAAALGRALSNADLELASQAIQGVARLCLGEIEDGTRLLDEVAAAMVAGEIRDMPVVVVTACNLITGCERIRDYDRAFEWCKHLKKICERAGTRSIFAVCRTEYAEILMWRGNWQDAENELETAYEDMKLFRPGLSGLALIRLARLRVRQGHLDEARQLLAHAEPSPQAQLVLAELALEQGDARTALDTCERFLRRLPAENRIEQANGLELLIRAHVALNQRDAAILMLGDLAAIVNVLRTRPLEASLSLANGLLAALDGAHDLARCYFEDAVDSYLQCGAIFETGLARIELAKTLLALSRPDAALLSAQRAREQLDAIGATLLARQAADLIARAAAPAA